MNDLASKVAIVTGGSRDIGAGICNHLSDLGMRVVIDFPTAHEAEDAQKLAEMLCERGGSAIAVQADVTSDEEVARLVSTTMEEFSRIDVIVNNAGGYVVTTPILDLKREDWEKIINVNVYSAILMAQHAVPHMKSGGSIINTTSQAAANGGGPGRVAYAASKGCLLTLTRGMSKEFAPMKIRVNAISPGVIDTSFHDELSPEARKAIREANPLGRDGEPADIAATVAFLASDASSYITGQDIHINGGSHFN